jgi:hypothetical protein
MGNPGFDTARGSLLEPSRALISLLLRPLIRCPRMSLATWKNETARLSPRSNFTLKKKSGIIPPRLSICVDSSSQP